MIVTIKRQWKLRYEGDEKPPTPPPPPPTDPEAIIEQRVREATEKHEKTNQQLTQEIENLRKRSNLSDTESKELSARLESLQNELKSKESTLERERQRLTKQHKEELELITGERDTWKKKYTSETIRRSLMDAGVKQGAVNPEQIVDLLSPKTHLVEELDAAGKPTGNYAPKVTFEDTDKDGNPIVVDMNPVETLKRMSEMDKHFNLFKDTTVGGAGLRSSSKDSLDPVALASDPAAWRAARKANKI